MLTFRKTFFATARSCSRVDQSHPMWRDAIAIHLDGHKDFYYQAQRRPTERVLKKRLCAATQHSCI